MEQVTFNLKNAKLTGGDYLSLEKITENISENESFTESHLYMTFDCSDLQIDVLFDMYVSGSVYNDSGDYWTPPSCDVEINNIEITIVDILINEDSVELTEDLKKIFENLVSQNLD